MPTTPDPADLLALATAVATRAAAHLVEGLQRARTTVETKSSGTDMVTEMDRAAEAMIVAELLDARPDDGLLGEEGAARPGTSGYRWVIDPLDGTTNYLYGIPGFAVSIAVEREGTTVAGVVVDPLHGETFAAVAGEGATRNGEPIRCSTESRIDRALVATGFGYDAATRVHQARVVAGIIGSVRDIRRFGAASVDLCSVAVGRVDAYYERGLQPWDLAAGALVAREAGATVEGLHGAPASGTMVVAAPPALFGPLHGLITAAGAA